MTEHVAAHVFVDDLAEPALTDEDRHHVERVLRLRPGEPVSLSDGRGGYRMAALGSSGGLEPTSEITSHPRPRPPVTVGFALVKGDRPEWIVQKLTEAGVDLIVPFVAGRSVVKWDDDKAARHAERWRAIARGAAMQSRRTWLPEVAEVRSFADALASTAAAIADMDGDPPSLDAPAVLVGPEGGWTPEERAASERRVVLGRHVYRAETAAVAAGVLLCALRGGLIEPPQLH